mmetsp:Transcript_5734/g.10310  ORF Transcript_5734/g.10310 Transcript_5734/m.10310 type:complete len:90 (+) Transcript_5734:277-546(+)
MYMAGELFTTAPPLETPTSCPHWRVGMVMGLPSASKSSSGRPRHTQVAEVEPDFHGEIVTGTDVIECYATYGHDARIKVSHCNKRYGRH